MYPPPGFSHLSPCSHPWSSCLLETSLPHLNLTHLSIRFQLSPLLPHTSLLSCDRCSQYTAVGKMPAKKPPKIHKNPKEIPPFFSSLNQNQIFSTKLDFLPRGKPPDVLFVFPFTTFHPLLLLLLVPWASSTVRPHQLIPQRNSGQFPMNPSFHLAPLKAMFWFSRYMPIDLLRDEHALIRLHIPACPSNTQFTTRVSLHTNVVFLRQLLHYSNMHSTAFQASLICGFLKFLAYKDPIWKTECTADTDLLFTDSYKLINKLLRTKDWILLSKMPHYLM